MLKLQALCAAAVLALAGAAQAADADDDITKQLIDVPVPATYRVDGQQGSPEIRKDPAVQGGQAVRVHVPGQGTNPWDIALGIPVTKPIQAGDRLVLAFWAKLVQGPNGATTITLPFNAVQMSTPPYTPVISGPVDIGAEWKLYSVNGVSDHAYKTGDVGITFHLATGKQVVDFGPVFLLDLGPAPAGGGT